MGNFVPKKLADIFLFWMVIYVVTLKKPTNSYPNKTWASISPSEH